MWTILISGVLLLSEGDSPFMQNVKKADANTIVFYSTMLGKLQSYMRNMIFQMNDISRHLHLEYPSFDRWTPRALRLIDGAIDVIKKRAQEVEQEDQ